MAARKKPTRRKAPARKTPKPATTSAMLHQAVLQRHLVLVEKITKGKGLTRPERKELAELEARGTKPAGPAIPQGPQVLPKTQREILVSTNDQVGSVFDVDGRTVQNWKRDEEWPDTKRGPYNLVVIGRWRASKLKRPADTSAELKQIELEAGRERMLFRRAKRRQEEAEALRRQGELIPASEVLQWFPQIFAPVATYLQGMVTRHPAERKQVKKVIAEIRRHWEERNQEGDAE